MKKPDPEVWKTIEGTIAEYLVSTKGRVYVCDRKVKNGTNKYRLIKGHLLKPCCHTGGYLQVWIDGKHRYIHRLVAEAFISNDLKLPEVNHIDENKKNNNVSNLEWCDSKYNMVYGTKVERTENTRMKKYRVKNLDTGEEYRCPIDAYKKTGIHNDGISRACRGKCKTAGGFHWGYING